MAVYHICGNILNQNLNANAISAHIHECKKKNSKKKRFTYIPVRQYIIKSSTS
jgi:hypothetical protein